MALRIHPPPPLGPPRPPKSRLHPLCFNAPKRPVVSMSCTGKEIGDAEVASTLADEVRRVHAQKKQKDEALSKSRALLFSELYGYLSLREDELQKKWERMEDGKRRDLAKEFVSNWSVHFHPLSVRSVMEMVREHLQQEKKPSFSNDSMFFPSLKRLMQRSNLLHGSEMLVLDLEPEPVRTERFRFGIAEPINGPVRRVNGLVPGPNRPMAMSTTSHWPGRPCLKTARLGLASGWWGELR